MKAIGKAKKHLPPNLYSDLVFIWDAFVALSSSRSGAITFSDIESYLNLNGIVSLERRQEVAHLIRIMDEKYIELMRKKYTVKNKK